MENLLRRESDMEYLSSTPNKYNVGETWLVKVGYQTKLKKLTITKITDRIVRFGADDNYCKSDLIFVEKE